MLARPLAHATLSRVIHLLAALAGMGALLHSLDATASVAVLVSPPSQPSSLEQTLADLVAPRPLASAVEQDTLLRSAALKPSDLPQLWDHRRRAEIEHALQIALKGSEVDTVIMAARRAGPKGKPSRDVWLLILEGSRGTALSAPITLPKAETQLRARLEKVLSASLSPYEPSPPPVPSVPPPDNVENDADPRRALRISLEGGIHHRAFHFRQVTAGPLRGHQSGVTPRIGGRARWTFSDNFLTVGAHPTLEASFFSTALGQSEPADAPGERSSTVEREVAGGATITWPLGAHLALVTGVCASFRSFDMTAVASIDPLPTTQLITLGGKLGLELTTRAWSISARGTLAPALSTAGIYDQFEEVSVITTAGEIDGRYDVLPWLYVTANLGAAWDFASLTGSPTLQAESAVEQRLMGSFGLGLQPF